jgi:hypothetical protein
MQAQAHADHQFIGPSLPDVARGQPQQAVSSGARSLKRLHLGLALWVMGFVAGFVFWKYVGFWGLIQSVFYPNSSSDRAGSERIVQAPSDPATGPQIKGGLPSVGLLSVKLSADNCTSLVLDRDERTMVQAPCSAEVLPLNSLRAARKEDRRNSVAEAKAAAVAATATPPVRAKPTASAPAVASWSSTIVTSPAR